MQEHHQRFCLEGKPRGLLLASISDSTSKGALQLRLPHLGVHLRLGGRPSEGSSSGSKQLSHQLQAPDLGRAGAELQRAAAVAGGVLVAAISQAAQRLSGAHSAGGRSTKLPLYQSFKLPWNRNPRSGSRR